MARAPLEKGLIRLPPKLGAKEKMYEINYT